ncbi:hypothetical protein ANN_26319 [Periplaneta americana]|uniref:Transposase Tc1-like domain-containing protein n=1 Tax=Periplaneta americana TaxID=6978 RepID=A0ABQ8S6D8_PERAM|nr:hypothetical protein ANN_26319 [Periplaneta americana]
MTSVTLCQLCIVIKHYREPGQYERRREQGRKRKTTRNQDRFLVLPALHRRTFTAHDLQNDLRVVHGIAVSDQTVRNRLWEVNLRARRSLCAPHLEVHHKRARLRFALE